MINDIRLQGAVLNLLAEPVYEGGEKVNGIAVKLVMRLHLLAHQAELPNYSKDNPAVAEALAALGDPADGQIDTCPVCKNEVLVDSLLSYNNIPNAICTTCAGE